MLSVRPATIFLFIFTLTAFLFSSCTITQRRYRSGFHLEWKHRLKGQESVHVNALKNVSANAESANEDTVVNHVASIRPTELESEKSVTIHQEIVSKRHIEDYFLPQRKIDSPSLSMQSDEVNHGTKTDRIVKNDFQKRSRDKNGGMYLLGFLFSLAVLIIPPLLFSVGAYWLDISTLGLVFIWLIWIAGIVGVVLLFSGLWPIILSCLIWNIVYTITVGIIILVNT